MSMSKESSSYQYDEIIKYQTINNTIPKELASYCVIDINNGHPILTDYEDVLTEIISNITKGFDPNSVVFRNNVKMYINTINQTNYDDVIHKLKILDFTNKENIDFLISELLIGAMRSNLSVKGFTFEEDPKYKTLPEICADVAKYFVNYIPTNDKNTVDFHNEIHSICRQYFTDYLDMNKMMDENNEDMGDNYKGFMTFMGLLYSRGIINIKHIIECMDTIKRAIYVTNCVSREHDIFCDDVSKHNCCDHSIKKLLGCKKNDVKLAKIICYFDCNTCTKPTENNKFVTYRKQIECGNLHKGYCHLLNHVVRSLEIRALAHLKNIKENSQTKKSFENNLEKLCEFLEILIKSHQEMIDLNKCYESILISSQGKSKLVSPLKNHSILDHNSIGIQFNKLQELLIKYNNNNKNLKYINVPIQKTM
jgi:hypothetical protein